MDPPTIPGRSGLLHTGYPEEGGADIPPREPPITAQQRAADVRDPPRRGGYRAQRRAADMRNPPRCGRNEQGVP